MDSSRAGWLALAMVLGCTGSLVDPPDQETASSTQSLGAAGIERMIPIRFTLLQGCDPAGPSCGRMVTDDTLRSQIEAANQVYRQAGVQFYIDAVEVHVTPFLNAHVGEEDNANPPTYAFAMVRSELRDLFPQMPLDAWLPLTMKKANEWVHAASALYEDPRRIHVWIAPAGRSATAMPGAGRGLRTSPSNLTDFKAILAHELGHFLGLAHTYALDTTADPRTLQPRVKADRWDLVYKPGTTAASHVYFSSRAQAAAYADDDLKNIDKNGNCGEQDSGDWGCAIGTNAANTQLVLVPSPALKGIVLDFPDGKHGVNVMGYLKNFGYQLGGLSDSQVEEIRKTLRWDQPFTDEATARFLDGFMYAPPPMMGLRPQLGNFGPSEPANHADFDHDGRRDLVYYVPARDPEDDGRFVVLLSGQGFDPERGYHQDLGHLGDIPAIADYDGDGYTDLAVYQSGGGLDRHHPLDTESYWRWCSVRAGSPNNCATPPAAIQFGTRGDTPIFGYDFDGNLTDDPAFYRPSDGTWHTLNTVTHGETVRAIGAAGAGVVPLPGLYDCDERADMAVYEPMSAKLVVLRSADGWSVPVVRYFDARLIPDVAHRAGVVPVAGMTHGEQCGGVSKTRRSVALWSPADGTWNVLWNPIASGTYFQSCTFASGVGTTARDLDVPIGGLDVDGDQRSDLAYISISGGYRGTGAVHVLPVNGSCNATPEVISCGADCGKPRQRMWAIPDMTVDGKTDLMSFDPETLRLRYYSSDFGYTVSGYIVLEDANAVVL